MFENLIKINIYVSIWKDKNNVPMFRGITTDYSQAFDNAKGDLPKEMEAEIQVRHINNDGSMGYLYTIPIKR